MIKDIIFTFSGTGNSLAIARQMQREFNCQLHQLKGNSINKTFLFSKNARIGFVFPVYHHGMPNIIKEFIQKQSFSSKQYIYACLTYADSPGITIKLLKEAIDKSKGYLAYGKAIQLPYNYVSPKGLKGFMLREMTKKAIADQVSKAQEYCKEIIQEIDNQKNDVYEIAFEKIETFVIKSGLRDTLQKYVWLRVFHAPTSKVKTFEDAIKIMDHGFFVKEDCNRCMQCVKICPVNNIQMLKNGPKWQHACEQCFACLQWCPQRSIEVNKMTVGQLRYHHPLIQKEDLFDLGKGGNNG